jgi:hypothetical protein
MSDYSCEDLDKLKTLSEAIAKLEGVPIPWNIIKHLLIPLDAWLDGVLEDLS